MYFLAEPIADLINANYKYIQLSAFFVLPMAFFMLHYESLRGLKRIAAFSFFYMMAQGLFTIVSVLIIHQFTISSNVPIYAYLVSVFIVSILSFLSFKYSLKKSAKGKESAEKELRSYSEILKISVPLMFAQSVQFIMAWTDKLMLGAIDTPNVSLGLTTNSSEVGIYHTAFKLSMFAAVALMSINSIASPKFAEMYASKNKEGLKKIVHQSTKMIFWVTLPLVVIFFSIPDFLLGLFGEEFKIGMFAFILLSCGKMISAFSGSVGNILQMTGNQNILARILFLGAIINVLLNLILIPKYGINGAAIASTISTVFWNITMVFAVKKKLGFYSFYLPFIR